MEFLFPQNTYTIEESNNDDNSIGDFIQENEDLYYDNFCQENNI